MSELYGQKGNDFVSSCPGLGECEYLEGVGEEDWTVEQMYEEARHSCPRECKRLRKPDEQDDSISETESEITCAHIQDLVLDFRLGNLQVKELDMWEVELMKYFIQVDESFSRNIRVKTGFMADVSIAKQTAAQ